MRTAVHYCIKSNTSLQMFRIKINLLLLYKLEDTHDFKKLTKQL